MDNNLPDNNVLLLESRIDVFIRELELIKVFLYGIKEDLILDFFKCYDLIIEIREHIIDLIDYSGEETEYILDPIKKILYTLCSIIYKIKQEIIEKEAYQSVDIFHKEIISFLKKMDNELSRKTQPIFINNNISSNKIKDANKTILLADDSEFWLSFTQTFLVNLGYTVVPASDGQEVIDILNKNYENIGLLILDGVMPKFGAIEILEFFKNSEKIQNIPVIIYSANNDQDFIDLCLSSGALYFFDKKCALRILKTYVESSFVMYKKIKKYTDVIDNLTIDKDKFSYELLNAKQQINCLLPPKINNSTIEIDYFLKSASFIGGDFFDYNFIDDEHFAFYGLDVSGHEVASALVASFVVHYFRDALNYMADKLKEPSVFFNILNKHFTQDSLNNRYLTMFYGVYNKKTRLLKFSSAGYNPGILFFNQGKNCKILKSSGSFLGCNDTVEYKSQEVVLSPNSTLYVFSDGITDIKLLEDKELSISDIKLILDGLQDKKHRLDSFLDSIHGLYSYDVRDIEYTDDFSMLELTFK